MEYGRKPRLLSLLDPLDEYEPYVAILRVEIKERALGSIGSSYDHQNTKGPMKPGKHDYIEFTVTDENHSRRSTFVVEKMKGRLWMLGFGKYSYVRIVSQPSTEVPSRSRFIWEPKYHWVVSSTELRTLLGAAGDHYSLFSANCWSYATDTVEALLNLYFRHAEDIGNHEAHYGAKYACLEAYERLETVKRLLPRAFFRLFYKPLSRKNPATWRSIFSAWFS